MERSTIFNGKIHYFDWAIFNSFLYVYQRVNPNDNVFIYFHDSATTLQKLHASGGLARRCTSFCSAVPETQNQNGKTKSTCKNYSSAYIKNQDLIPKTGSEMHHALSL